MSIYVPGNVSLDSDGFRPPPAGGAISARYATFTFEDTTQTTLFTLPAGSVPIGYRVTITTDFDAGTNNNLAIGIGTDADYFATAIAIGTAANYSETTANNVAGRIGTQFTEDTAITVTYAPTGTAPTAGVGVLIMSYIRMPVST